MPDNVFAVQLSQAEPQQITPQYAGGVAFEDGLRAMLSVTTIWAKLQTTVLFGDSLFMIGHNIGQLTPQDGFYLFLKQHFNRPIPAVQLNRPPFAATPQVYMRYNNGVIPPVPTPISKGIVTMLNAGFDPLRGYWIELAGNYFLTFPLFKNWPSIIRDTPNFKGAQGSGGTPGTPGSGTPPIIPPTTC